MNAGAGISDLKAERFQPPAKDGANQRGANMLNEPKPAGEGAAKSGQETFVKTSPALLSDSVSSLEVSGRSFRHYNPQVQSAANPESPNSALPNTVLQNTPFPNGVEIPAGNISSRMPELFKFMAAQLGLPQDFLSAALFAFSGFFSLPPGKALLGNLRREILSQSRDFSAASPRGTGEESVLEAEALGAAAVFDKGVALEGEALSRYAAYLAFPSTGDRKEKGGEASYGEEVLTAEEIKAIAEDEAEKDGLLNYLNRIPGKNGQYWTVFPFKIRVKGTELKVFLRLLNREPGSAVESCFLVADISASTRQWRFVLEKNSGKLKADIRVYPDLPERRLNSLKKKARRFFSEKGQNSKIFDEITVRNEKQPFSWARDLFERPLPYVNEEV